MISIIIPAHKEGGNLNILLSKLATIQGMENAEVIIALSPDSSLGGLNDAEGKIQFLHCKKKGRAAQMNEGAAQATGSALVFLHADVRPPTTFLSDIKNTLDNGYKAGFFSYKFDKDNFWLNMNASFTKRDGVFTGGGDQCLFITKAAFESLGRFDNNQLLMEDFEFFKRMKKNKIPYKIINNQLIVSARKYEKNSYLRVNSTNLLLVVLFNFGCSSVRLKSIHDKLIRT